MVEASRYSRARSAASALRAAGRAVRTALLAGGLAACGAPSPDLGPAGAWFAGRGPAIGAVLEQLAALEGTRLARRSREVAAALPDCEVIGAHDPDSEGDLAQLVAGARCLDPADPLEAIRRETDADLVFGLPVPDGDPLRGALRFDANALAVELRWPSPGAGGPLALLLPGAEPAGPDRLAAAQRLVHARVRPRDGIDLAALVPAGSQADHLFRLRSHLLARGVLDGTWEAAAYLPERAGGMPGLALALGVRLQGAAVAAAERLLAELQQTWPVTRSALQLATGEGACLEDLNVMPELAPCYVATGDALVVGWNARSLERALGGDTAPGAPEVAGRLDVDLGLVGRADAWLARHLEVSDSPLRWPWRRLLASGGLAPDDALVVRLTLLLEQRAAS